VYKRQGYQLRPELADLKQVSEIVINKVGHDPYSFANKIRYYAEENPAIRITRYNFNGRDAIFRLNGNGDTVDRPAGENPSYWIVEMPSGAKYTMGDNDTARSMTCYRGDAPGNVKFVFPDLPDPNANPTSKVVNWWVSNDSDTNGTGRLLGAHKNCLVTDWRVTKGVDVHGNEIIWQYKSEVYAPPGEAPFIHAQEYIQIDTISYNYYQIGQEVAMAGSTIKFDSNTTNIDRIETITVSHAGQDIREYKLVYAERNKESVGCSSDQTGTNLVFSGVKLETITQWGKDENGTWQNLPATSFGYEWKPHFNNTDNPANFSSANECFHQLYLTEYKNGYGGVVRYRYDTVRSSADGRDGTPFFIGEYTVTQGTPDKYDDLPSEGYSWRVSEIEASPGRGEKVTTKYDYWDPTYNYKLRGCTTAGAFDSAAKKAEWGGLCGHHTVTTRLFDRNDKELSREVTTYFSDSAKQNVKYQEALNLFEETRKVSELPPAEEEGVNDHYDIGDYNYLHREDIDQFKNPNQKLIGKSFHTVSGYPAADDGTLLDVDRSL